MYKLTVNSTVQRARPLLAGPNQVHAFYTGGAIPSDLKEISVPPLVLADQRCAWVKGGQNGDFWHFHLVAFGGKRDHSLLGSVPPELQGEPPSCYLVGGKIVFGYADTKEGVIRTTGKEDVPLSSNPELLLGRVIASL